MSSLFATAIYFGGGWSVLVILVMAGFIIFRTHMIHRQRVKVEDSTEVFNLRKIRDAEAAIRITFEHAGLFLTEVNKIIDLSLTGLFKEDRQKLRAARVDQRRVQQWSNIIAANVFKVFRLLQWQEVKHTRRYAQAISSLQEISESLRDIVVRSKLHVANNHSGLLKSQIQELQKIYALLSEILLHTAQALEQKACPDCDKFDTENSELQRMVRELDEEQIQRIQHNQSKTRLSILFYSLLWDAAKIADQTLQLRSVLQEWLTVGNGKPPDELPPRAAD
ncbi:MAG: hypothetical protein P8Y02_14560 [Deinococcales bacterium]